MKRLAFLAVLVGAAPGWAQSPEGVRFTLTNDLTLQQNDLAHWELKPGSPGRDPRKAQDQFMESLSLTGSYASGSWGDLAGGLTLRSTNLYLQQSDVTLAAPDTSLYRKYLKYSQGGLSVEAGDFYAMLGRGMVLSVLPIDKLLKERTVEGVDVQYRGDWLELRALSGKVQTETREQAWRVNGGEVAVKLGAGESSGVHRLGVHAAEIDDVRTDKLEAFQLPLMRRRRAASFSLGGDNVGQMVNYYVERARLTWERKPDDFMPVPEGEATYANLSLHAGGFYMLGEFHRYLRFESDLINPQNTLNNPPLTDREDEKNNLVHSEATRLLMQVSLKDPDLSFFVSGVRLKENDVADETSPDFRFDPTRDTGHQVYGGFTAEDLWDCLTVSATHGVKRLRYPEWRTDASAALRFTPLWSLEAKFRDKRHDDPLTGTAYRESDTSLQLSRSPWVSFYYLLQQRSDPGRSFTSHRLHSGGFRVQIRKGSFIDLSGGSIRGGLVCSGGQCREMPDFKGWKLATHFVF